MEDSFVTVAGSVTACWGCYKESRRQSWSKKYSLTREPCLRFVSRGLLDLGRTALSPHLLYVVRNFSLAKMPVNVVSVGKSSLRLQTLMNSRKFTVTDFMEIRKLLLRRNDMNVENVGKLFTRAHTLFITKEFTLVRNHINVRSVARPSQ